MPQFFLNQPFETGNEVEIIGRNAHHITDVLRLKTGNWLILSDGKGRSFKSEIISVASKRVRTIIKEEIRRETATEPPTLAFAVIKHDRSEWIIQKAVELGCRHIIPFYCQRTIPKYASAGKKHRRWQEIALEAAKQSGLPFVPQVDEPIDFDELCSLMPKYEKTILFWEGEKKEDFKSKVYGLRSKVLLIIGPEGGFDESEIGKAKACGAITISLGQQILRVETAAIAALAIMQYELGNLNAPQRHRGAEK